MSDPGQKGPTIAEPAQGLQSFVRRHGNEAVTVLTGGAAAALGAITPFAHVNGLFGSGVSYSLIQAGFYGLVLLMLPITLGILPVFLKQYLRFKLAAFGIACALFGVFFSMWLVSSGLAGAIGGSIAGFSIGFFLSLSGYAAMVYGYYSINSKETGQPRAL